MVQVLRRWSGTSSWQAVRLTALMAVSDTYQATRPLATRLRPGVFRVVMTGDIDTMSSRRLTLIAQEFLQSDRASAELDLQGVTFMDSAGLLLLVRLHRTAAARGGTVTLLEPSGSCLQMIECLGLDKILVIRRQRIGV